jgi:hypothetical protein
VCHSGVRGATRPQAVPGRLTSNGSLAALHRRHGTLLSKGGGPQRLNSGRWQAPNSNSSLAAMAVRPCFIELLQALHHAGLGDGTNLSTPPRLSCFLDQSISRRCCCCWVPCRCRCRIPGYTAGQARGARVCQHHLLGKRGAV